MSDGTPDSAASFSISSTWLSHSLAGLPIPFDYRLGSLVQSFTPGVFLLPV